MHSSLMHICSCAIAENSTCTCSPVLVDHCIALGLLLFKGMSKVKVLTLRLTIAAPCLFFLEDADAVKFWYGRVWKDDPRRRLWQAHAALV